MESSDNLDEASNLIKMARISGEIDREEDAVKFIIAAAVKLYEDNPNEEFEIADRNLLCRCLKAVVKPQRLAVRKLYSQIHSEKIQGTRTLSVLIEYLESKKEELKHTCLSIVCSIRDIFLPMASTAETRVFFNKIAGDYSRYICEIPSDETIRRNELIDQTESFYVHAFEEAQSDLSPAHPERLSLVLNFSTFLREIKGDAERSMELAKDAFDDAAAELGIVAPKFDSVDSLPLSSSFDETFTIDADVSEQTNEFEEEDSKRILDIIRNTLKRLEMNL